MFQNRVFATTYTHNLGEGVTDCKVLRYCKVLQGSKVARYCNIFFTSIAEVSHPLIFHLINFQNGLFHYIFKFNYLKKRTINKTIVYVFLILIMN